MIILGIESSCDETAVAIVNSERKILSNQIYSQIKEHKEFGGVVPEVAARSHIECLPYLFQKSLQESSLTYSDLDGIAVTAGPGLIGGVMVGVIFAKTVASILKKPFIAVNHLEGHALTVRLTDKIEFPYLLLLASGGHCQFLLVEGINQYKQISTTVDDAAGEAFDKVAKMLNLDYPGGPAIEKLALKGNPKAFQFPKPLCEANRYDLSFSGLKTAVRQLIEKNDIEHIKNDICASFQDTVAEIFLYKINQAIEIINRDSPKKVNSFVIAGGVAANKYIREKISEFLINHGYNFIAPPIHLCTDNAAMIAWAGLELLQIGLTNNLDFEPRSRWPL
ncbi:MAG: tRNA (adenosine(37)-N6)-threonylcarbamoyltransferase complex transferase subunit TsaD [Candidatus Midichloria mitochondrii]|nr:tRNA (adenosine(37)-N6)-threonylcarbamoyltransferase complex transferase subunit TsaD [Candidatus Midichloria mitochondrii]MDJ1288312.1 tRNA (adenosine(37)-N6)-threonylcarbamoyltransferase complex transferase subunit TsaD [Candidatus Midichloria mitochondrii]MDJ1299178.1 tRNA (adenosine(37)-N6)-threonylcarbamoyltransferase complex transferase subunit TsaD [Candidatus Midichloria mitochondrii]MDJ1313299.1 tRNA (adenosine(37)-N6)-threonylcarbamoyltransferase complex transferase subunit TsaD [Ca